MLALRASYRHAAGQWAKKLLVLAIIFQVVWPVQPVKSMPAVQANVPRFEPGPCNFDVQTSLVEGTDLKCGSLIVPEQHANPGGATIQLGVAIIKSHDPNPAPDPVVMLQGGPGGSTIDTYLQMIPLSPKLREMDRDIVLFDQRGTMYAKPSLFCEQYYEEGIRQLNEDISDEESNKRAQAAMKACRDQFAGEGINLSAYNSFENAADVEALRQVMGWDQINLYGVSYGTLLALHVLREYPQGLRSVILDSVVPPQINFIPEAPQSQNRALEAVFQACAADADCNAAYPNLKNEFYETVRRLNANKASIQVTDVKSGKTYPALMDGDTLISGVVQMLYLTDWIPLIPRVIYSVRAGDYSFMERVLSLVVFDRTMSLGMYFSVLCTEDADFQPSDASLQGLPEELAAMEKEGASQFLETCSLWNVSPLPPKVDEAVSSDVPTLVLTGYFDPITPPAYAQEAAKTLSNHYYFEFPAGGHGELTSGDCQDAIFLEFIDNPNQKPDGSCIAAQKLEFSTPGSIVPLPELISLLNLQGSTAIELIVYALALLFLLTALVVYPIAWLVSLFRHPAQQAAPVVTEPAWADSAQPVGNIPTAITNRRPWIYRLGPWLAGISGMLLLVFIIVVAAVALNMALANDSTVLLGLPGSTRPLFLLPLAATVLAALMVGAVVLAWGRKAGSVWGRLYFSLLTLSAWVCIAILCRWGMLAALFA
jgi:pimeloyl-ACP methyl ester carboxylesterase